MNIRNFAIIAHIDHGKSTLADRLMELTGLLSPDRHEAQMLDRNPISRERGITIKLAPVTMDYKGVRLNLIDTPGHVDFSYEVERTLESVEGVILLVDATQGMQAQTIAHAYKAIAAGLTIIPAVNKIDVESARVEETVAELASFVGCSEDDVFRISAKTGVGVQALLDAVIEKIEPPKKINDSFSARIFDSYYDPYRGVIAFVRVVSGAIKADMTLRLLGTNTSFVAEETGIFLPDLTKQPELNEGMIGYVVTNQKDIRTVRVGDTIRERGDSGPSLGAFRIPTPMVFASVFPTEPVDFPLLKKALDKLILNDASLQYESIYSEAFGAGCRVGFLGLLHADVSRERLEREFGQSIILTPPQVDFKHEGETFLEPMVILTVVTPSEYMGPVMRLCEESRGLFRSMDNATKHLVIVYDMPLDEIVTTFFDRLKSVSSGYASVDWDLNGYTAVKASELVIMLNGDPVREFSEVVVAERADERARTITSKLRELIPRQQFEVRIQAYYSGRILASERIAPFRKDVTAKLYGGDRTRKDKLLNKQKEGKKKMKQIGKVSIPKEAFQKLWTI